MTFFTNISAIYTITTTVWLAIELFPNPDYVRSISSFNLKTSSQLH